MATSYFKHAILIAVGLSVPVVAVAMRGCEATDGDPTDAGEAESSQQEAAPSSTSTHDPDASKKPDAKPDSGGKGGSGGSGGSDSDVVEPPKECDSQPIPSTVPKGWEEYPVMDCKYRLYVPSSPEYLPSPLVWEPCSSKTGPLSYNCRQIKMDWPSKQPAPYGIAGLSYAHVDGDGKVLLQFRKLYEQPGQASTGLMAILVEADGPVRQALWRDYSSMYSKAIYVDPSSVTSGKSSWTINEVADNKSIRVAALGGGDTLLRPPVLHDLPNGHIDSGTVEAGPKYYFKGGHRFRVRSWEDNSDIASPAGGGGGGAYSWPFWVGSTLVFAVESSPTYRILRWTEQDGTRVLVGFLDDDSKGAGQPGSDGVDLVWTQGEDLEIGESKFPNRWVMTSKFSTDPSDIVPRRLVRWVPTYLSTFLQPPAVGCGYAAIHMSHSGPVNEEGILVVRLSDAVSWVIPSVSHAPADSWGAPIAITCDEVFAVYRGGNYDTIRRVRLNSLGPGTPPPD